MKTQFISLLIALLAGLLPLQAQQVTHGFKIKVYI